DVFPVLLAERVPFFVHQIEEYWNDVGSLAELRQGTFDALAGELRVEIAGTQVAAGITVGEGSTIEGAQTLDGPIWVGRDVSIGAGTRLIGPLVIGDGARIGGGAARIDRLSGHRGGARRDPDRRDRRALRNRRQPAPAWWLVARSNHEAH